MENYVNAAGENCNHCTYKKNISRHWNMEDYCSLNRKRIGTINIGKDCPLGKQKVKLQPDHFRW